MKKLSVSHTLMALFIIFAFVLRLASESTANMSYIVIAIYALKGRQQAIQALALSWVFSMLNPGVAPEPSMASIGRYAVILGASTSVLLRSGILNRGLNLSRPVLATLLLGVFFVLHSLFFSSVLDVSILKALSWVLVTTTLFSAWAGLPFSERDALTNQIFGGLVIVLLISLPLLFSSLGYLRNDSGFQGILSHPQSFGPTIALLGVWAAAICLGQVKPSWKMILLIPVCLVTVVLSEARTAGLAMILGLCMAVIGIQIISPGKIQNFLPGLRSSRVLVVITISAVITVLAAPFLSDRLQGYFTKRSESVGLVEAYDTSRGALISKMWANIEKYPFFGIGFGIDSYPNEMIIERDPVIGLPISAVVEKGVLPIAVLEELGVVGSVMVGLWLWMILRRAVKNKGLAGLALVFTVLLINMGEAMFFSPGGMGLLMMILITYSVTVKATPHRNL